jgi:hypothetical protein
LDGEGEAVGAVGAGEADGKRIAFAPDEAGATGVGAVVAGEDGGGGECGGFFGAEEDGSVGKKAVRAGRGEGGGVGAGAELTEEERPREGRGAFEAEGSGAAEAGGGAGDEHVAEFVEAAAAGAADHLEEIVGRDLVLDGAEVEVRGGDEDGAQGKIDAGAESERGEDGAELAGLGEGFDEAGALGVGEAAMVVGDAVAEEFGKRGAGELLLLGGEGEGFGEGDLAGELAGEALRVVAVGGKDEDRAEALAEGAGDATGPEALDGARQAGDEIVDLDFFEGDGALGVDDDFDGAAEATEPGGDLEGIGDGAGEEEELEVGRGGEEGALVVVAAGGVGEPVVFVDNEEVKGR